MFANGFALSSLPSGNASEGLVLDVFFNHDTSHAFTAASDAEKKWAVANGYTIWKKQVRNVVNLTHAETNVLKCAKTP